MSAFTDDELKKLKKARKELREDTYSLGDILSFAEIDALLARLDAAEKVCGIITLTSKGWLAREATYQAWRRTKGLK